MYGVTVTTKKQWDNFADVMKASLYIKHRKARKFEEYLTATSEMIGFNYASAGMSPVIIAGVPYIVHTCHQARTASRVVKALRKLNENYTGSKNASRHRIFLSLYTSVDEANKHFIVTKRQHVTAVLSI